MLSLKRLTAVLSGPALQASFSSSQLEKLDRFRAFMFHLAIFLWHMFLNYHATLGVFVIFHTRMDLINKTFGLGSQYITVWNQIIQQVYFNACLLQDILEFTSKDRFRLLKGLLRRKLPFAFTSFVFPISFLVFINFWAIYSFYPRIIDEDNVTATFFPNWLNHGLHTTIIILCCIEKFVVHRSYPTKLWGLTGLLFVILSYSATCCVLYVLSGLWPYPLFRLMNNIQRLSYLVTNCLLGFLVMIMGEAINKRIWRKRKEETEKKSW